MIVAKPKTLTHAEHEHVIVDSLPERAGLVAELVAAL